MIESLKAPQNRSSEFYVPTVSELALTVKTISPDTLVLDVLKEFQNDSELMSLPVLDENHIYLGAISRRHYLTLMTKAFARELYARKSLDLLLKDNPDIFTAPLIANGLDRIDQVMTEFLKLDPGLMYEALPVINGDGGIGVVKVADMMLKLSQTQGKLIDTMQQLSARLNEEVANAAALQRNLLRPAEIELLGVRGLSTLITSSEVGGDFYDYYMVDERWAIILIGDVSGHGIAAGTIVCAAKAGVNFLESEQEKEPHKILERLSNIIYNTAHQTLLMTMFAVCLDTRNGELRYANAGHQFGYIYRSMIGRLDALELGGLPLGKDPDVVYEQEVTEMDVGDRLFLYTDSIVEEEDDNGECFGYDRLESLIVNNAEQSIQDFSDNVLETLAAYLGRHSFTDDVTLLCVDHTERTHEQHHNPDTHSNDFELVRIVEAFYRTNPNPVSPNINRQNLVFLTEGNFSDLVPDLAVQGVRRILHRRDNISQHLGWDSLLKQHQHACHDDLSAYLHYPQHYREFFFTHTDDKAFIIQEAEAWLEELHLSDMDRLDAFVLLLDELIENGLYAAPQDSRGRQLYPKGTSRQLDDGEMLSLTIAIQDGIMGVSLTDSWGTLTPSVFLERLSRHIQGQGLKSGIGGGGLYLIWRMSDYLQLRVFPRKQTQVCVFIDLNTLFEPETDKSFQFLYHTEVQETVTGDTFYVTNSATAF
ncbi:hypothetical protein JCM14076_17720 [Methylosoma difficile]